MQYKMANSHTTDSVNVQYNHITISYVSGDSCERGWESTRGLQQAFGTTLGQQGSSDLQNGPPNLCDDLYIFFSSLFFLMNHLTLASLF